MPDTTEYNESATTTDSENEQSYRVKCYKCSAIFSNDNSLKRHAYSCGKPKIFECQDCLKKYATTSLLNFHMKRNCAKRWEKMSYFEGANGTEPPAPMCSICSKTYTCIGGLDNHLRTSKCGSSSRYQCGYCNRNYKNVSNLEAHQRQKHKKKHRPNDTGNSTDAITPTVNVCSNGTSEEKVDSATNAIEPSEEPQSSSDPSGQQKEYVLVVDLSSDSEGEDATAGAQKVTPLVLKVEENFKRTCSSSAFSEQASRSSKVSAVLNSERKIQRTDSKTTPHCSTNLYPTELEAQKLLEPRDRNSSLSSENLIKEELSTKESEQQTIQTWNIIAGGAQSSFVLESSRTGSCSKSEPTTTNDVPGKSRSVQQELEEIEAQNLLQPRDRSSSFSSEVFIEEELSTKESEQQTIETHLIVGEAQSSFVLDRSRTSSCSESLEPTSTNNVPDKSSSLQRNNQQKLEEIVRKRKLYEREKREAQWELKLIQIERKEEELDMEEEKVNLMSALSDKAHYY